MKNKILVLADPHFKESLPYSEYIDGGRDEEKEEILDYIISQAEDCGSVVILGDSFDHKNNCAEVVRSFVEFIERFGNKELYIFSGNHEKKGDGKTAIDFLKEVKKPNWHIITKLTVNKEIAGVKADFLPYMLKSEFGVETEIELTKEIMKHIKHGEILFHHHMVSGTSVNNLVITDQFKEPILPKEELEKRYKLIFGGHIHLPQSEGKTYVAGNVFNSVVGDIGKFVWKIDTKTMKVEKIPLPGRKIYSFINPTEKTLTGIEKNSIIKAIVTDKKIDIDKLKEMLLNYDAYMLVEQYPNKRQKVHFEEGALDVDIDKLLKIYSEEKKIDFGNLIKGWELIK